ncbi:MAG TPA: hypothetical protein VIL46_14865, partial [Gemmataceae bacterium]
VARMTTYQIQGPTRRCSASGRELQPGEKFYSVLHDEGGRLVRRDYAAEAWPGPPEGAVAYWMGRIPASGQPPRPTFNDELLWDCFEHLAGSADPKQLNFRYVLALLLMRRKRLKFEDLKRTKEGDFLVLVAPKGGGRFEVLDPHLSDEAIEEVQREVVQALGWE